MSETSSSSGISEHREDSPQDNELSSNLVQGEESSNTAATQCSQIPTPPSSAPPTPLVTSEGPDQSQDPEDASTAKQRPKLPVSKKSPEHTFVMAMPRKGRPTDQDGPDHIYAFTSKSAPDCVKIGCKQGDIFDAYSRIDEQNVCYDECEPMAVLATKYHKNAERLAHHILRWKDGPTEETRVTCLGCHKPHREWFRWR